MTEFLSLRHRVYTDRLRASPSQWAAGTLSLGRKAVGAWCWPLLSIYYRGYKCVELYFHFQIRLHGTVLN